MLGGGIFGGGRERETNNFGFIYAMTRRNYPLAVARRAGRVGVTWGRSKKK